MIYDNDLNQLAANCARIAAKVFKNQDWRWSKSSRDYNSGKVKYWDAIPDEADIAVSIQSKLDYINKNEDVSSLSSGRIEVCHNIDELGEESYEVFLKLGSFFVPRTEIKDK